jgi:hypothetical protein
MKELNNKIARQIIEVSGIDLFQDSRRREVVEVRAIFIRILKEHQGMTFYGIKDYFCDNNKCIDHTTVIYANSMFDVYIRYNPKLKEWYDFIVNALFDTKEKNSLNKKNELLNNIEYLSEENIDNVSEYVDNLVTEQITV